MRLHFPKLLGCTAGAAVLLALYVCTHRAALLTSPVEEEIPVNEVSGAVVEPASDDSETPPPAAGNPVGEGVPVSRLAKVFGSAVDILGPSRDAMRTIPLSAFRQAPVKEHLVGPGDTLGIWIEGIVGKDQPTPDSPSETGAENGSLATGFPYVIPEDGKLQLPLFVAVQVLKKTLPEVRDLIRKAYLDRKEPAFLKGKERMRVSLMQPRKVRVQVVREDARVLEVNNGVATNSRRSYGQTLELPIYENDVFSALVRSGGPPHQEARDEIVVERSMPGGGTKITRLPMRVRMGEKIPFSQNDITLENGDVVFIEARDTDVYYTGGLMQSRQIVLPRDYDVHALQAVADANGPIFTPKGGVSDSPPSQLSVIRRTKDHGLITIKVDLNKAFLDPRENIVIQPGDFLILQEVNG